MSSKSLCAWVRVAVVAVAVCGLILCGFILPVVGSRMAASNPEIAHWYLPWLIFLLTVALPCFVILIYVWKVSGAIGREEVFTPKVAGWVKASAVILFADVGYYFVGNIAFIAFGLSHMSMLLLSVFIDIFAISLATAAAVLSRYIAKAAALQEDSEGTI